MSDHKRPSESSGKAIRESGDITAGRPGKVGESLPPKQQKKLFYDTKKLDADEIAQRIWHNREK